MNIYSKITPSKALAFDSEQNKDGILGASLHDMDYSGNYETIWDQIEESPFDEAQLGEAYQAKKINEDEIVLWFGISYAEWEDAPEHVKVKIKTFKKILALWKTEREEYKKDSEAYKKAIERGEKVFEIDEN